MPFIQWNESMSVGVAEFDSQHQVLLELVNELFDAMRAGKSRTVIGDVLKKLIEYTQSHFEAEERKMREHGYPGFVTHHNEHQKLVNEVSILYQKFQVGDVFLSVDTLNFLKDWVTNHIMQTDMAYRPFFTSKGIQ